MMTLQELEDQLNDHNYYESWKAEQERAESLKCDLITANYQLSNCNKARTILRDKLQACRKERDRAEVENRELKGKIHDILQVFAELPLPDGLKQEYEEAMKHYSE